MLTVAEKPKTARAGKKIPESLIYEIMDGEPLYYKGYKEVLSGKKTLEEIMGSSSLQFVLVHYLLGLMYKNLDEKLYYFATNEAGIHVEHNVNMSNDVAVYRKSVLTADKISKKYADVPCRLAIEIDIKADISNPKDYNYVQRKTQKLLDFGVEKVIWIFTGTQKVTVAAANENWQTMDWDKEIALIDGLVCNIGKYLAEEGIQTEKED
ncbi:MAG: Uma2 family endonuclease [Cytophagales bacterium]|jgi:Uma2 family endonuclease|nr:Uma2 family endonuclease [Cytophagales bacterium]